MGMFTDDGFDRCWWLSHVGSKSSGMQLILIVVASVFHVLISLFFCRTVYYLASIEKRKDSTAYHYLACGLSWTLVIWFDWELDWDGSFVWDYACYACLMFEVDGKTRVKKKKKKNSDKPGMRFNLFPAAMNAMIWCHNMRWHDDGNPWHLFRQMQAVYDTTIRHEYGVPLICVRRAVQYKAYAAVIAGKESNIFFPSSLAQLNPALPCRTVEAFPAWRSKKLLQGRCIKRT